MAVLLPLFLAAGGGFLWAFGVLGKRIGVEGATVETQTVRAWDGEREWSPPEKTGRGRLIWVDAWQEFSLVTSERCLVFGISEHREVE